MRFQNTHHFAIATAIALASQISSLPVFAGDAVDYWRSSDHASQIEGQADFDPAFHVGFSDASECPGCGVESADCGCDDSTLRHLTAANASSGCEVPWWSHRTALFGEFLWLRPGSSDVIFATEQTDPDPDVASPTGPLGITNMDAEGGFRVGFSLAASPCSSLVTTYTRWDGSVARSLQANGGNVLDSNIIHPSTETSGAASLAASAEHHLTFQTVDLNYRHRWKSTDSIAVNWLGGVRYGNLDQRFRSDQEVSVATGLTTVNTDVDFEAFGIAGGLDFETYSSSTGLSLYGRTLATLIAGEWKATYDQTNQFGGGEVRNRYEDFRASPVLEAELGIRWMAPKRHLRLSTGFLMSAWYETLTTRTYVDAVRAGDLIDAGETMTFSGLTARAEWRF